MPKEKPAWEKLEIICAEIQKKLSPDAIVKHNHWVKGKSGRRRKLDISISQILGSIPVFIVFDCKKHNKPVKMKDVEAFIGQKEDVGAHAGIMISESGFDAGAKAVASIKGIHLQTYRDAHEADWDNLLGQKAWTALTQFRMKDEQAAAIIGNQISRISPGTLIFNDKKEPLKSIFDFAFSIYETSEVPKHPGEVEFEILPEEGNFFIYIPSFDNFIQVDRFLMKVKVVAMRYILNFKLASGEILEDVDSGKIIYKNLVSEGIAWEEMIKNQQGVELSPEEYGQQVKNSQMSAILPKEAKFIRLTARQKESKR